MAVKEQEFTKSGLVLDSLEVKNFRAFKHLTIEKLGRVNLITGKNNVGKTSLLEAIWLYAESGQAYIVERILLSRNEITPLHHQIQPSLFEDGGDQADDPIRPFLTLFNNVPRMELPIDLRIGTRQRQISLSVEWMTNGITSGGQQQLIPVSQAELETAEAYPFLTTESQTAEISHARLDLLLKRLPNRRSRTPFVASALLPSIGLSRRELENLWEVVQKNGMEVDIVSMLRLLIPDITSIFFAGNETTGTGRIPYVRTDRADDAIPLARFGSGLIRLFGIGLTMHKASNGIFMCDEIENGLHYSIQLDIWRFIFQISTRLNIQVFATTHSWECIEAFERAAAEDDDTSSGVVVRLQRKNGNVVSTVLNEESLNVITDHGIEIR